jgi:hypothetical protein
MKIFMLLLRDLLRLLTLPQAWPIATADLRDRGYHRIHDTYDSDCFQNDNNRCRIDAATATRTT